MSIRTKLTIFVSTFVCIILAMIIVMQFNQQDKIDDIVVDTNEQLEEIAAEDVRNSIIEAAETAGRSISIVTEEKQLHMIDVANYILALDVGEMNLIDLQAVSYNSNVDDISITDENGIVIESTKKDYIGTNILDEWSAYELLLENQVSVLLSDISESNSKIEISTAVGRKIEDGTFYITTEIENFDENIEFFIQDIKGYKKAALYGKNQNKIVSFHNEKITDELVNVDLDRVENAIETEEAYVNLGEDNAEVYYPVMQNGNVRYVMYVQIDTKPYYEYVNISNQAMKEVNDERSEDIRTNFVISIVAILIVLLILLLQVNHTLKPLVDIVGITKEISKGKLTSSCSVKSMDEIGQLGTAFNHMIVDLRILTEEIRSKADMLLEKSYGINQATNGISTSNEELTVSVDSMVKAAVLQEEESENTLRLTQEMTRNVDALEDILIKVQESIKTIEESIVENKNAEFDDESNIKISYKQMKKIDEQIIIIIDEIKNVKGLKVEVLESIENIAAVAEETVTFNQEVNALVEEQNQNLQDVAKGMNEMDRMACDLYKLVDMYELE